MRGQLFPERGNRIEASRRRMADYRQRFRQARQLVERCAHLGSHIRRLVGRAKKFFALLKVAVAKCFHAAQSTNQMAFG